MPAEDLGGQDDVLAQGDVTGAADGPVNLDGLTRWRRGQGRFTGGPASLSQAAPGAVEFDRVVSPSGNLQVAIWASYGWPGW